MFNFFYIYRQSMISIMTVWGAFHNLYHHETAFSNESIGFVGSRYPPARSGGSWMLKGALEHGSLSQKVWKQVLRCAAKPNFFFIDNHQKYFFGYRYHTSEQNLIYYRVSKYVLIFSYRLQQDYDVANILNRKKKQTSKKSYSSYLTIVKMVSFIL